MISLLAASALTCLSPTFAAAAPPGFQGQPFEHSRTYWRSERSIQPAWFLCEPLDGTDMTVVTLPDDQRRLSLTQPLGNASAAVYRVGRADPGAGQIYWSLSTLDGQEVGALHAFNPGVLDDPKEAMTAPFVSIRASAAQWNCRWLERTRVTGFSARRAVAVTQDASGRLEYRTYDDKDAGKAQRIQDGAEQTNTPSLDIQGGRESGGVFSFASGDYVYEVSASPVGARITVHKAGKVIQTEPLIAWTIAPPPYFALLHSARAGAGATSGTPRTASPGSGH